MGNDGSTSATLYVAIAIVVFALVLTACSAHRHSNRTAIPALAPSAGNSTQTDLLSDVTTEQKTLTEALVELDALKAPKGVDAVAFAELKVVLEEELRTNFSSDSIIASTAPGGEAGRVVDLKYDQSTNTLSWSYANKGDYDLNGIVDERDIAQISLYFNKSSTDFKGSDDREAWIDGDGNGEVGISDITFIARNYLNEVAGYRILTSESPDGNYVQLGDIEPFVNSWSQFPVYWSVELPTEPMLYIRVAPVNRDLEQGELSAACWQFSFFKNMSSNLSYLSLALDSTDSPYLVYCSGSPNYNLECIRNGNDGPEKLIIDEDGCIKYGASIGFDSDGIPHVVYNVWQNQQGSLMHSSYVGDVWQIEVIDINMRFDSPSIAIDSLNRVHVVYSDLDNTSLKYAKECDGVWEINLLDSHLGWGVDSGIPAAIAIDSHNCPHTTYYDYVNKDLKYASLENGTWKLQIVDSVGDVGMNSSLALDSHDKLYISYYDQSNGNLKMAHREGTTWVTETIDGMDHPQISYYPDAGKDSSLEIDKNGKAHLIYWARDALTYALFDGSHRNIQTLQSSVWYAGLLNMALDTNGNPILAYFDYSDIQYPGPIVIARLM